MRLLLVAGLCSLLGLMACRSLPEPDRGPKTQFFRAELRGDSMAFFLRNELDCPIQVKMEEKEGTRWLAEPQFSLVEAKDSAELLTVDLQGQDSSEVAQAFSVVSYYSHPDLLNIDSAYAYAFPFPESARYQIMQGYGGSFSHTSEYSYYAIDFNLGVGDTICAAREGIVIEAIEGNHIGGGNRKYRPYANVLTIFHSDGTLGQYVHLAPNGALVELGDSVKRKQPVGISGLTGFTSAPHLHFAVIQPLKGGAKSMPVRFGGIAGKDLRKNMWVPE
ncbi:MAG: M23 family metallopeptidase [Bacteroidota bacterium]